MNLILHAEHLSHLPDWLADRDNLEQNFGVDNFDVYRETYLSRFPYLSNPTICKMYELDRQEVDLLPGELIEVAQAEFYIWDGMSSEDEEQIKCFEPEIWQYRQKVLQGDLDRGEFTKWYLNWREQRRVQSRGVREEQQMTGQKNDESEQDSMYWELWDQNEEEEPISLKDRDLSEARFYLEEMQPYDEEWVKSDEPEVWQYRQQVIQGKLSKEEFITWFLDQREQRRDQFRQWREEAWSKKKIFDSDLKRGWEEFQQKEQILWEEIKNVEAALIQLETVDDSTGQANVQPQDPMVQPRLDPATRKRIIEELSTLESPQLSIYENRNLDRVEQETEKPHEVRDEPIMPRIYFRASSDEEINPKEKDWNYEDNEKPQVKKPDQLSEEELQKRKDQNRRQSFNH